MSDEEISLPMDTVSVELRHLANSSNRVVIVDPGKVFFRPGSHRDVKSRLFKIRLPEISVGCLDYTLRYLLQGDDSLAVYAEYHQYGEKRSLILAFLGTISPDDWRR